MSIFRAPLPRRAKSHNFSTGCKRTLEDNETDATSNIRQISAMRLINDSLSCSFNVLNDELIKRNEELTNKNRFITKKERFITETLKSNKLLKDELSEKEIIIKNLNSDLHIANERIKSMELTIKTQTHSMNINGKAKGGVIVEFKRNIISYILTNDDPEGIEYIEMMIRKSKLILNEYPKEFFIKALDGNKQFVFGVLDEVREVDKNDHCIICKKKFRDTNHGNIIRVPFGVTMLNTRTTINVGPFCGFHKLSEDGMLTPLNFMTKPGTFDCIL